MYTCLSKTGYIFLSKETFLKYGCALGFEDKQPYCVTCKKMHQKMKFNFKDVV